jgi:DNA-binding SARP family transcriptional activator
MRGGRRGAGWSDQAMMTPAERQAHRAKMASFTSYDECHAYADQHHQEMMARAQAKGASAPAVPPRDACLRLKPAAK